MAGAGGGGCPAGGNDLQWCFSQVKGAIDEDVAEADIISTVEFNYSGDLLATGDKGGRVVIFQREQEAVGSVEDFVFLPQREVVSELLDRAACCARVHTSQSRGVFDDRWLVAPYIEELLFSSFKFAI